MITFEIKSEKKISFEYSHYKYHRRGRKAIRTWYPNGQKIYEAYWVNDKEHRWNRPSYTSWWSNGQKRFERYCIDGKYHRLNGKFQSSKHWNEQGRLL